MAYELHNQIAKQMRRELYIEGREQDLGRRIFEDWRDREISLLCAYMRTIWPLDAMEIAIDQWRSWDWCNAAVTLLASGPIDTQDRYLRASQERRDAMIEAVLADNGIENEFGHWMELPPK